MNYDIAADIIISSLEEQTMRDVPMASPAGAQTKPLPPAQPPQMPSRTDPKQLLGCEQASQSSRGTFINEEQDTLALSADVQWQQGPSSAYATVKSDTQGEISHIQEVPMAATTSRQHASEAPSLTFGGACLLTGVLLYAIQLGQQAEAEAHGRSFYALDLLRRRQQQNLRANHAVDESDGKPAEKRIQAARAKVCAVYLISYMIISHHQNLC